MKDSSNTSNGKTIPTQYKRYSFQKDRDFILGVIIRKNSGLTTIHIAELTQLPIEIVLKSMGKLLKLNHIIKEYGLIRPFTAKNLNSSKVSRSELPVMKPFLGFKAEANMYLPKSEINKYSKLSKSVKND